MLVENFLSGCIWVGELCGNFNRLRVLIKPARNHSTKHKTIQFIYKISLIYSFLKFKLLIYTIFTNIVHIPTNYLQFYKSMNTFNSNHSTERILELFPSAPS